MIALSKNKAIFLTFGEKDHWVPFLRTYILAYL